MVHVGIKHIHTKTQSKNIVIQCYTVIYCISCLKKSQISSYRNPRFGLPRCIPAICSCRIHKFQAMCQLLQYQSHLFGVSHQPKPKKTQRFQWFWLKSKMAKQLLMVITSKRYVLFNGIAIGLHFSYYMCNPPKVSRLTIGWKGWT